MRERPEVENFGEKVLEDCRKLVPVRDLVVDWVLLESVVAPSQSFSEALTDLLERFRELAARPEELNAWNESWFEAHRLFVYETFLYIIASLLKARAFEDLNNVFTSHFLLPSTERHGGIHFMRFDGFWTHSDLLNSVLSTEGRRYLSPAAEVVKRQANREDSHFLISFKLTYSLYLCRLFLPAQTGIHSLCTIPDTGASSRSLSGQANTKTSPILQQSPESPMQMTLERKLGKGCSNLERWVGTAFPQGAFPIFGIV